MTEARGSGRILYMMRDATLETAIGARYRVGSGSRVDTYPWGLQALRQQKPAPFAVVIADGLALDHSEGDLIGTVHEIRTERDGGREMLIVVVTQNPDLQVREADAVVVLRPGRLEEAADQIAQTLRLTPKAVQEALTIGFISNKGGEGKTTVAAGLCMALTETLRDRARREHRPEPRTLLADLDLSDGNVGHCFGLDQGRPDLAALLGFDPQKERMSEQRIREHIVPVLHAGLDVLLAPLAPGAFLRVTSAAFTQIRSRLVGWYDLIGFDHNSQLMEKLNLVSLAACGLVVAVMSPTKYGYEGMRRLIPTLRSFKDLAEVRIVVNMALPEDRQVVKDLEREFQVPVLGLIPTGTSEIRDFRHAQHEGLPVPRGRSSVWKALREMAEKLCKELAL